MERKALSDLEKWLDDPDRKPLILRGARQVGKTWLVRRLAKTKHRGLIEINFEKRPDYQSIFDTNDVSTIISNLEAKFGQSIDPQDTLLFLDEIQAAPELIAKLRWFAEDLPALPVVAAGSLLEFVLKDHKFSMPVGRIQYQHLEPLSFGEFLLAKKKDKLQEYLARYTWETKIPATIHEDLMLLFAEYVIVGGLPAAVSNWSVHSSLSKVSQIHYDLLATYRDDFAKYSDKLPISHLEGVLKTIPQKLSQKFVYSQVNCHALTGSIKKALQLLTQARISHCILSAAGNGIPIGAEVNHKFLKVILLDVGLACSAVGLKLDQIKNVADIELINKGGIAEQVVGQLLRTIEPAYVEPALYYWTRPKEGAASEIDYLIQHGTDLIPIEVKSGKAGTLKSLHIFMEKKHRNLAVRINANYPEIAEIQVKGQLTKTVKYKLLSLPFYLTEQLHRLIEEQNEF